MEISYISSGITLNEVKSNILFIYFNRIRRKSYGVQIRFFMYCVVTFRMRRWACLCCELTLFFINILVNHHSTPN
uniref:Unkown protein n=1 Tax=Riptortus pedestris TaxID=329032 RepID=R4WDL2_RIPPE|nr:unkown protein [Riptortus pedestris]